MACRRNSARDFKTCLENDRKDNVRSDASSMASRCMCVGYVIVQNDLPYLVPFFKLSLHTKCQHQINDILSYYHLSTFYILLRNLVHCKTSLINSHFTSPSAIFLVHCRPSLINSHFTYPSTISLVHCQPTLKIFAALIPTFLYILIRQHSQSTSSNSKPRHPILVYLNSLSQRHELLP